MTAAFHLNLRETQLPHWQSMANRCSTASTLIGDALILFFR